MALQAVAMSTSIFVGFFALLVTSLFVALIVFNWKNNQGIVICLMRPYIQEHASLWYTTPINVIIDMDAWYYILWLVWLVRRWETSKCIIYQFFFSWKKCLQLHINLIFDTYKEDAPLIFYNEFAYLMFNSISSQSLNSPWRFGNGCIYKGSCNSKRSGYCQMSLINRMSDHTLIIIITFF